MRTGKLLQGPVVVRVARGGAVGVAAARADEGEGQVAGCIRAVLPYMAQPIALEAPDLVCRDLTVSGGDSGTLSLRHTRLQSMCLVDSSTAGEWRLRLVPSDGRMTHATGALVRHPEQVFCWPHGAASAVTEAWHGTSMTAPKGRLTVWAVVGIVAKLGAQDAEGLASGTGAVPGEVAPLATVEALFRRRLEASLVEVPARGTIRLSRAGMTAHAFDPCRLSSCCTPICSQQLN